MPLDLLGEVLGRDAESSALFTPRRRLIAVVSDNQEPFRFAANALRAAQYCRMRSATACRFAGASRCLPFGRLGADVSAFTDDFAGDFTDEFTDDVTFDGAVEALGFARVDRFVASPVAAADCDVVSGAISIPNISERSSCARTFARPGALVFDRSDPAFAISSC